MGIIFLVNVVSDQEGMQLALKEARKGIGLTAPNPPVGAVIIKEGKMIASGWHHKAGLPHAEREALAEAKRKGYTKIDLQGSTLYVTLEPCSTYGKTPPCTEGIIEAGISRVVYGAKDPNPKHQGRADQILKNSGIEVISGILEKECREILKGFTSAQIRHRPWVIVKAAFSLDGKQIRPQGESPWLSCSDSLRQVHQIRQQVDAILVGGQTVRTDNPSLTIRLVSQRPEKEQPLRIIITNKKDLIPKNAHVFSDIYKERTRVYCGQSLKLILEQLTEEEKVHTLLVEAGPTLLNSFIKEKLIDEWIAYITPLICGGPYPQSSTELEQGIFPWMPVNLKEPQLSRVGRDLCLRGNVIFESNE